MKPSILFCFTLLFSAKTLAYFDEAEAEAEVEAEAEAMLEEIDRIDRQLDIMDLPDPNNERRPPLPGRPVTADEKKYFGLGVVDLRDLLDRSNHQEISKKYRQHHKNVDPLMGKKFENFLAAISKLLRDDEKPSDAEIQATLEEHAVEREQLKALKKYLSLDMEARFGLDVPKEQEPIAEADRRQDAFPEAEFSYVEPEDWDAEAEAEAERRQDLFTEAVPERIESEPEAEAERRQDVLAEPADAEGEVMEERKDETLWGEEAVAAVEHPTENNKMFSSVAIVVLSLVCLTVIYFAFITGRCWLNQRRSRSSYSPAYSKLHKKDECQLLFAVHQE